MKKLLIFLIVLLIPTLACSTTSVTENLLPSLTGAGTSGGVLYEDYFDNPASGWGELSAAAGSSGYVNGAYHINIAQKNINFWSHPGQSFTDSHTEVSVMPFNGPANNRMGLICRLQDDKNFYSFFVSADGFYGIAKTVEGVPTLLTGNSPLPSTAIKTGREINLLRADCVGDTLTLFVNDVQVASVQDGHFSAGDVGILAGSFDEAGQDIYFDNFVVYQP